jgi:hypothetical protein
MLCSWNHRLLYSKSIDWKIIGLEPWQNLSVRGAVKNNNNNKQKEIPKKIYLFPIFFLFFFSSTRNDVTPRLLFVIQTEREWGREDRSSILFYILIIFFFTSAHSLPLGVWIEFEIVIDTDTVLRLEKERIVIEIIQEGETK